MKLPFFVSRMKTDLFQKTKINEQIRPNKIKHTDTENRAEVTKGKWARDQTGKGDQLYGD